MLLVLHICATLFMTGVIWFVQLVHYPLFTAVGSDQFMAFHARHQRYTTLVVAPPMLLELATGVALIIHPGGLPAGPSFAALFLLLLILLSTALIQVPLHRKLADGYDQAIVRRLLLTNWIRTGGWTARALLLVWCTPSWTV